MKQFKLFYLIFKGFLQEKMVGNETKSLMKKYADDVAKYNEFYGLLIKWVSLLQNNKAISQYLSLKGYYNVAIYGMKELGVLLLNELENTDINVKYAIDRDADKLFLPIDIYKPEEKLDQVDAIIVTAIHYYDEIKIDMENKMNCPILSLADIVTDK